MLDLGLPLWVDASDSVLLPRVPGFEPGAARGVDGVILSHPHADHFGLIPHVPSDIPLYMGAAARRILAEAQFFTPWGLDRPIAAALRDRKPIQVGGFRITPYLMDHSAYDSYALLVETGSRRLFYTGDLRAHGRKSRLFEKLVRNPPGDIDVLLMEGTNVRASAAPPRPAWSEIDVERACARTMLRTRGLVLAIYSPQNIDRLVTLYRAARRTGRTLVMDLYTASVAAATGWPTIPQASWKNIRVFLPNRQRNKVIATGQFHRTDAVRPRRLFAEELAARSGELVLTFRPSMAPELERADCLRDARAIWSLWPGYLREPRNAHLRAWLRAHDIPFQVHHASGHAHVGDLQRLVRALDPRRVVPIHTEAPQRFADLFAHADVRSDGEWWDV